MSAFATLHSITDARSPIMKLSRKELEYLAQYEKRPDIIPGMPAELMKRRFMERPPARMPLPMRRLLGSQQRLVVPPYNDWIKAAFPDPSAIPETEPQAVREFDAVDELERQWEATNRGTIYPVETNTEPPPEKVVGELNIDWVRMPFHQLKKECATRGIPFKRTDNKLTLVGKLNG